MMWNFLTNIKLLTKRDQGRDDLLTADDDEDDDEDGNNFIVDDQGNPVRGRRTHGGENMTIEDDQLREAQAIFGIDYDPGEFGEEEGEEDEDEEFDDYSQTKRKVSSIAYMIYPLIGFFLDFQSYKISKLNRIAHLTQIRNHFINNQCHEKITVIIL